MLNNRVDDVTNTILTFIAANCRLEKDSALAQSNFDVENGHEHVLLIVVHIDLLSKVGHGGVDTIGDTLNDESVNVVLVIYPLLALFVGTDDIHSLLLEFVNLLALDFDSI